jgi:tRNA(Ile)-lysidine synthase
MRFSAERLLAVLQRIDAPQADGYVVAFSGGLDSSVLLHALVAIADELPAPVRAVHINHQLQPQAEDWERHCRRFAAAAGIDYQSAAVTVSPVAAGLEAAARSARYRALKTLLHEGEWLLTAHHADDQLETVLLQLLRGGGPAGIAGMPDAGPFGTGWHVRPLLGFARTELDAYAALAGLAYLDDPSNTDRRHDRNFLRHEVVTRLKERWPAAAMTVSRAARHAAQASELLADLAALDLERIAPVSAETLPVASLLALGRARAANLLRYWLAQRGLPLPDTRRLDELLAQLQTAADDKAPCAAWAGAEVHCWRGRLYAFVPLDAPAPTAHWNGADPLRLGSGPGELHAVRGPGGIKADILARGVQVRFRAGGERIRPAGHPHHRELKNLLQEAGVVPWMRARIPLLWSGEVLAAVGDLWIAEECAAKDGEGMRIEWRNRPNLF